MERARRIYKDANKGLRDTEEKEERLILLEAWKDFEVKKIIIKTNLLSTKTIAERLPSRR